MNQVRALAEQTTYVSDGLDHNLRHRVGPLCGDRRGPPVAPDHLADEDTV